LEQIQEPWELIQNPKEDQLMLDDFRNRYMSINEAAHYLQTTKSWIYQNHRIRKMPVYKLNQQLLFKADELDAWLSSTSS